ncbi:hypothetical protein CHARACLAT_020555 [Characodon lateralis]|uniref:Uncharacterized protein n=1 Tax=Characodon lateralis TaxID=208331 RepID=A0ABU7E266_9TELE|nr:hypothetical protein [Characodon lateralis]
MEQVMMLYGKVKQQRRRRRLWLHQILQRRNQFAVSHDLLQELRLDDGRFDTSVYAGPSLRTSCPALGDESASGTPTTGAISPLQNACPSVFVFDEHICCAMVAAYKPPVSGPQITDQMQCDDHDQCLNINGTEHENAKKGSWKCLLYK